MQHVPSIEVSGSCRPDLTHRRVGELFAGSGVDLSASRQESAVDASVADEKPGIGGIHDCIDTGGREIVL
jgi:hypothetical protein